MKKILIIVAGMMMMGSIAVAAPITFTDTTTFSASGTNEASDLISFGGNSVNYLSNIGDQVTWRHQFTFNYPVQSILGATLRISLRDDERDIYSYSGYSNWESGLVAIEGGILNAISNVDSKDYIFNINPASLLDGMLNITLASLWGDFYIDKSVLSVSYNAGTAPVPEPGTIILLGAGLLGLGLYGRKRMNG